MSKEGQLISNFCPSPHFNERPLNVEITTIVIHSMCDPKNDSTSDAEACAAVLDAHRVSAHYLISQKGEIWLLVEEKYRAWHAGESEMPHEFGATPGVNDFSIGIELLTAEDENFTDEQYRILTSLIIDIATRNPIKYILGHEDVARPIGRKTDPGARFDWKRLQAAVGTEFSFPPNVLTRGKIEP